MQRCNAAERMFYALAGDQTDRCLAYTLIGLRTRIGMITSTDIERETPAPTAPLLQRLLENRESQFWVLQFVGWSGWATAGILVDRLRVVPDRAIDL